MGFDFMAEFVDGSQERWSCVLTADCRAIILQPSFRSIRSVGKSEVGKSEGRIEGGATTLSYAKWKSFRERAHTAIRIVPL
jgi:hypothetical protein